MTSLHKFQVFLRELFQLDYNILWQDGEKSYLNTIFGIDSDPKNANLKNANK
jgi:hypothetical protein